MHQRQTRFHREGSPIFDDDWQDPQIISRNKISGRSFLLPYPSVKEALSGQCINRINLDGDWDFRWNPAPKEKLGDGDWDSIAVPGNWELSGFDRPQYLSSGYPFSHDTQHPPALDPEDNPTGTYRKFIDIEADRLAAGDIILRFGGIRSAAHVFVNGDEVGYTENSYSPSEFSIKDHLRIGKNEILVRVYKWCAGSYLEDQDNWRLGGIFRSVDLMFFPVGGLFDLDVSSRFDGAYRDARLRVRFNFSATGNYGALRRNVRWYLYKPGEADVVASSEARSVELSAVDAVSVDTEISVNEPRAWNAEDPYLYNLVAEISDDQGEPVDVRSMAWGFRQIDILTGSRGGRLLINGQEVKLRGLNRHEFHPRHGQALPEEIIESDLLAIKRMNVNALYCGHHPCSDALYEIADRIGLYVIDEANISASLAGSRSPKSPELWIGSCLDRVDRMVLSHRNHPSVIMWSLGSRSSFGRRDPSLRERIKNLDSSRPLICSGDKQQNESDLDAVRSPSTGIRRSTESGYRLIGRRYSKKPIVFTDFARCFGVSLGGFGHGMDLIDRWPNVAGAFVGSFADRILVRGRDAEEYRSDYHGPQIADGILNGDRDPKPEAAELKALYAPVRVEPVDLMRGRIAIENRYSFINLSSLEIRWTITRNGAVVGEGTVRQPDIGPGSRREITIYRSLEVFPGSGEGFINFTFRLKAENTWAPAGHPVALVQVPLPELHTRRIIDPIFHHLEPQVSEEPIPAVDSDQSAVERNINWRYEIVEGDLLVAGKGIGLRINLANGRIDNMDFGQGNILTEGIRPDFFRPSFGGESGLPGTAQRKRLSASLIPEDFWKDAGAGCRLSKYRIGVVEGALIFIGRLRAKGFIGGLSLRIIFGRDGVIRYSMRGRPQFPIPRFGIRFAVAPRYREVRWFGFGPEENYEDRRSGVIIDQHTTDAGNLAYDYLHPQAGGLRTGVRRLSFSDGASGLQFEKVRFPFSFSGRFASREAVEIAEYAYDIEKSANLHIHVDGYHQSVADEVLRAFARKSRARQRALQSYGLELRISRATPYPTSGAIGV